MSANLHLSGQAWVTATANGTTQGSCLHLTTLQHGKYYCTCAAFLRITHPIHRALPLRVPSPCRGREGRPLCPCCLSRQMLTMQALCGLMQCCCIGFTVMQAISCSSAGPLRLQPDEHVLQLPDTQSMSKNVQAKSCHEALSVTSSDSYSNLACACARPRFKLGKDWQCDVACQMACIVCATLTCGMQKEQGSRDIRLAGT